MSVRNLIVSPQDGWVEVANTGSGFVTAGGGLQHCIYTGTPPNVLVGHRYSRKPIQYSLGAGESLWVRVSQPVFVVVSEDVGRSPYYLRFDGVMSYGEFAPVVIPVASEFEFSCLCVVGDVTGTQDTIIAGDERSNNELVIDVQDDGRIRAFIYDNTSFAGIITSTTSVENSTFTLRFVISSNNDVSLFINEVLEGTGSWGINGLQNMTMFGARASLDNFFTGIIANPKISIDGVDVLDCTLDQKGSNTQTNKADTSNPITLHNVDHGNDWFENVDGKLLGGELADGDSWINARSGAAITIDEGIVTAVSGGTTDGPQMRISCDLNVTYILSADYSISLTEGVTSDYVSARFTDNSILSGGSLIEQTESGSYSLSSTVVANVSDMYFGFLMVNVISGDFISVTNPSVREYIGDLS